MTEPPHPHAPEELFPQGQAHGGDVWGAARSSGLAVEDILDLSACLNPLGPPPGVKEAIGRSLDRLCHYPDRQCLELRRALAASLGLHPANLLPGNGAPSLLQLLGRALTMRDIVVLAPAFGEIPRALALAGSHFHFHPLSERNRFEPGPDDLDAIWARSPSCVILSNPLTPSGGLVDFGFLDALLQKARRRRSWVVVDESYMEFAPEESRAWAPEAVREHRRVLVLRSLAKFYCLAGLRLSHLMGHADTIVQLAPLGSPWSVNHPAQVAGVYCLQTQAEFAARTRRQVAQWRDRQGELLRGLGLAVLPSQVNYQLVRLPQGAPGSDRVAAACARQGVLVRDCSDFPGCARRHLRVAVARPEDQSRLAEALGDALEQG
jgi:threonine-phosphate decarboxylase